MLGTCLWRRRASLFGFSPDSEHPNYFGKHDLEFGSHLLSDIFSHSACVGGLGGVCVCAKATVATLKATTVNRAFIGGAPWVSRTPIKRSLSCCVPLHLCLGLFAGCLVRVGNLCTTVARGVQLLDMLRRSGFELTAVRDWATQPTYGGQHAEAPARCLNSLNQPLCWGCNVLAQRGPVCRAVSSMAAI